MLMLMLLTAGAQALPANLDLMTTYSYPSCAADALCARRWFIDDAPLSQLAQETFTYLFANWADTVGANYVVSLDTCSQFPDSETTSCHELNFAWLVGLRGAVHCQAPNQRFVYGRGCVCPAGANCRLNQSENFILGIQGLTLLMGVFALVAVFYMSMQWYRARQLEMSIQLLYSAESLPVRSQSD